MPPFAHPSRLQLQLTAVIALTGAATLTGAADDPPKPNAPDVKYATPGADQADFLGDRINYDFALEAHKVQLGQDGGRKTPACIKAGTSLKGRGKVLQNGEPLLAFRVSAPPPGGAGGCDPKLGALAEGDVVLIDPKVLQQLPPNRFGLSYGTLLVPYKYQIKGDKSLSGGASLGGYLGYREAFSGYSSRFVVFGGVTKVDVPKTSDGQTQIESVAGLSYGVGWLGTVKDSFQLGLVIGADRVGKSAAYVNNGKTWLALSLGFPFSN